MDIMKRGVAEVHQTGLERRRLDRFDQLRPM
jgi:hypothetical protein